MKPKLMAGSSLLVLGAVLIVYGLYASGVSADTIFGQQEYLAFGLSIVVGAVMILVSIILFILAAFSVQRNN